MGEGKTEAAVSLAASLASGFSKSGCYFALPTSATSNCMHARIKDCFQNAGIPQVRLLHGHAWMYEQAGLSDSADAEAQAWLAPMRRAILAPYGVGTVDQALMAVLRIRFTVLRLLGLTGKVLIIDEIHAYDAYMQQTLSCLLSWTRALQIPAVLLSATLPSPKRRQLLESCGCKDVGTDGVQAYPLVTLGFLDGRVERFAVDGAFMRQDVLLTLMPWMKDIPCVAAYALSRVKSGGCAGIIANNTAWGCNYLMWYNNTGDMILTNVNNIVENARITSGKNWFRSGSATARSFADYTFSGDTPGVTFDTFTVQGPSNLTALSEEQINFKNTNDVSAGDFLKIDITSVAANSDAANTYPELGLPVWAGWAEPVPEPAAVLLVSMFALPAMLRRR